MIRKLLFTFLLAASNLLAYSRFTPGNSVVVRVENGTITTHVSLSELDPIGTLTSTLNMGASTPWSWLTTVGASNLERLVKLSNDKQCLTLGG